METGLVWQRILTVGEARQICISVNEDEYEEGAIELVLKNHPELTRDEAVTIVDRCAAEFEERM